MPWLFQTTGAGCFEQPAHTSEERDLDLAAHVVLMGLMSADQIHNENGLTSTVPGVLLESDPTRIAHRVLDVGSQLRRARRRAGVAEGRRQQPRPLRHGLARRGALLAYAVAVHADALLILSPLPSAPPRLKLLAHFHLTGASAVLGAITSHKHMLRRDLGLLDSASASGLLQREPVLLWTCNFQA